MFEMYSVPLDVKVTHLPGLNVIKLLKYNFCKAGFIFSFNPSRLN